MLDRARDSFTSVRWFMEDHTKIIVSVVAVLLAAASGFFVWQTFFHEEVKAPSSFEGVPLVLKPITETPQALYPKDATPECKAAADSLEPTAAFASWVGLLEGMDMYQSACAPDMSDMAVSQGLSTVLLMKSPNGNPAATPDYTKMEECFNKDRELAEAIPGSWRDFAPALDELSSECDARSLTSTEAFKRALSESLSAAALQQSSEPSPPTDRKSVV